ncbi:hypothetical protein RI367_008681 [Sorochytrium milnesiophthora]
MGDRDESSRPLLQPQSSNAPVSPAAVQRERPRQGQVPLSGAEQHPLQQQQQQMQQQHRQLQQQLRQLEQMQQQQQPTPPALLHQQLDQCHRDLETAKMNLAILLTQLQSPDLTLAQQADIQQSIEMQQQQLMLLTQQQTQLQFSLHRGGDGFADSQGFAAHEQSPLLMHQQQQLQYNSLISTTSPNLQGASHFAVQPQPLAYAAPYSHLHQNNNNNNDDDVLYWEASEETSAEKLQACLTALPLHGCTSCCVPIYGLLRRLVNCILCSCLLLVVIGLVLALTGHHFGIIVGDGETIDHREFALNLTNIIHLNFTVSLGMAGSVKFVVDKSLPSGKANVAVKLRSGRDSTKTDQFLVLAGQEPDSDSPSSGDIWSLYVGNDPASKKSSDPLGADLTIHLPTAQAQQTLTAQSARPRLSLSAHAVNSKLSMDLPTEYCFGTVALSTTNGGIRQTLCAERAWVHTVNGAIKVQMTVAPPLASTVTAADLTLPMPKMPPLPPLPPIGRHRPAGPPSGWCLRESCLDAGSTNSDVTLNITTLSLAPAPVTTDAILVSGRSTNGRVSVLYEVPEPASPATPFRGEFNLAFKCTTTNGKAQVNFNDNSSDRRSQRPLAPSTRVITRARQGKVTMEGAVVSGDDHQDEDDEDAHHSGRFGSHAKITASTTNSGVSLTVL